MATASSNINPHYKKGSNAMALNPTSAGESNNWNYSKPLDEQGNPNPSYSDSLRGTVIAIQEIQATQFGSGGKPSGPAFWPDGNPKMDIRLTICGPNGGFRTWIIQPAGKAAKEGRKKSVHIDLFNLAGGVDLMNLIGKTIDVSTVQPPAPFSYGLGNPRPWKVALAPEGVGPFSLDPVKYPNGLDPMFTTSPLYANAAVSGGQVAQAPQNPATPAAPAMPTPPSVPAPATYDEDIPF